MADLAAEVITEQPELPRAGQRSAPAGIEDAKLAVNRFLKTQPDVKHASVTKLTQAAAKGCWEAEAEVYVPNMAIKALRLAVRRQVLDRRLYVLRLDSELNVVAYELKDAGQGDEAQA